MADEVVVLPPNGPQYSPERHILLVNLAQEVASFKLIAEGGGITLATLNRWMKQGEQGIEPYAQLSKDIKAAQVRSWRTHIERITEASKRDYRASQWMLERMLPDEFGSERKLIAEQAHTIEQQRRYIEELLAVHQKLVTYLPTEIQQLFLVNQPNLLPGKPDDSE